jgi:hypothetical protein
VGSSREFGNEPSGSIKCWEVPVASRAIWKYIVVWKNRMLYEVCCSSSYKDYVLQLKSDSPVEL